MRRVSRLTKDELSSALGVLTSEHGRMVAFSDGLMVYADRVEVLERVSELCDLIESGQGGSWVVQLYVLSVSEFDMVELGLDSVPLGEVALSFANASNSVLAGAWSVEGSFGSLLRAVRSARDSSVFCEPLFLLRDGETGEFVNGEQVPVPRKTVSGYGVVQTTGWDYQQTGVEVRATVREYDPRSAVLSVACEIGEIVRYIEDAPVTARRAWSGSAVVQAGGVYLLGNIESGERSESQGGGLGGVLGRSRSSAGFQIWARVALVAGAVGGAPSGVPTSQPVERKRIVVRFPPALAGALATQPGGN